MECQLPTKEASYTDHRGRTPEQQQAEIAKRLKAGQITVLATVGPANSAAARLAEALQIGEVRIYNDLARVLEQPAAASERIAAVLPLQNADGEMATRQVAGQEMKVMDAIRAYGLPALRLDVAQPGGMATMAVVTPR